jgi:hypothetical protein
VIPLIAVACPLTRARSVLVSPVRIDLFGRLTSAAERQAVHRAPFLATSWIIEAQAPGEQAGGRRRNLPIGKLAAVEAGAFRLGEASRRR